ncbi:MAG: hypothetical protein FJ197_13045 [Gammaproteobacteria bacterium]|nr:hypothetical protein [Gammaproteobacteria bacterium]
MIAALNGLREITPGVAIRFAYRALILAGLLSPVVVAGITRLTYPSTQLYSPYFSNVFSWSLLAALTGGVLLFGARRAPAVELPEGTSAAGIAGA